MKETKSLLSHIYDHISSTQTAYHLCEWIICENVHCKYWNWNDVFDQIFCLAEWVAAQYIYIYIECLSYIQHVLHINNGKYKPINYIRKLNERFSFYCVYLSNLLPSPSDPIFQMLVHLNIITTIKSLVKLRTRWIITVRISKALSILFTQRTQPKNIQIDSNSNVVCLMLWNIN